MPVYSRWSYDPEDPYAVTLSFSAEGGRWVAWNFARDLLYDGLRSSAGLGDVRVYPDIDLLVIELDSPDGHAVVEMERVQAENFLVETTEAVPIGEERIDIDAFLAEIIKV
nr:SsgA family sporulation/cell division regulator [Amycolatopsis taiwanensis]